MVASSQDRIGAFCGCESGFVRATQSIGDEFVDCRTEVEKSPEELRFERMGNDHGAD